MFLSSSFFGHNCSADPVNPLHNASFRKLFAAQVIALVGTGLSTVALTLLASKAFRIAVPNPKW